MRTARCSGRISCQRSPPFRHTRPPFATHALVITHTPLAMHAPYKQNDRHL